jgi:hypothetical protein
VSELIEKHLGRIYSDERHVFARAKSILAGGFEPLEQFCHPGWIEQTGFSFSYATTSSEK